MTDATSALARKDLVRAEVRRLLERAPAFGWLSTEGRRQTAHDTVMVGERLADPGWLEAEPVGKPAAEAMSALRERIAGPRATGLAQGTGGDFKAGAGAEAVQAFDQLVKTVDFPQFVASLIHGVFQAIVDASIQQMQAYQTLVASIVKSAAQVGQESTTPAQARQYLVSTMPDQLQLSGEGDSATVALRDGASLDAATAARLGVDQDARLEDKATQQRMVLAAQTELGRQQQQTLATLVMMGINRIIVTNGRINAKVLFDVSATDDATRKSSNTSERSTDTTTSSKVGGGALLGAWGGGFASTRTSHVSTRVSSALDETSESKMQLKAQLSGDVDLYFKSETFPLERLATSESADLVRQRAAPGAQESRR